MPAQSRRRRGNAERGIAPMSCRKLLGGLAVACVTLLHLMPVASTQERMQLGVPLGIAAEFQAQVGDRVFFSEGSAELGTRARTALEAQAAWLKRNAAVPVT